MTQGMVTGKRRRYSGFGHSAHWSCLGRSLLIPYGRAERPKDGAGSEFKGDERLKNIEPKMVELIMNEVCRSTVCRFPSFVIAVWL